MSASITGHEKRTTMESNMPLEPAKSYLEYGKLSSKISIHSMLLRIKR
jgi:hypothetical protein